jgi:hypothetical protein
VQCIHPHRYYRGELQVSLDLVLPPFTLDTREWLVATPDQSGIEDEYEGRPMVAMLSTAVVRGNALCCGRAVIGLGLAEQDESELDEAELDDAELDQAELDQAGAGVDTDESSATDQTDRRRYVLRAPDGRLALLAEFETDADHDDVVAAELLDRFDGLMRSFRWTS